MSGEWEAEEIPDEPVVESSNKWEGEDDDDNVKDNWFDEDDEQIAVEEIITSESIFPKKKIISEKISLSVHDVQEQKIKEYNDVGNREELSADERLKEKLRLQKIQEEADLELAKETFGDCQSDTSFISDSLNNKEDFDILREKLIDKLKNNKNSIFFMPFLEELIREICNDLSADDVKKLVNLVTVLHNEKLKQNKNAKVKKKKAKVYMGKETDFDGYNEALDDYHDMNPAESISPAEAALIATNWLFINLSILIFVAL